MTDLWDYKMQSRLCNQIRGQKKLRKLYKIEKLTIMMIHDDDNDTHESFLFSLTKHFS